MPGCGGLLQGWLLVEAALLHVGTARAEGAPRRRVHQIGRSATDGEQSRVRRLVELGDGRQQRLGVGHLHLVEQHRGGRRLDDSSGVHHGDVVGSAGDDAEVVRDQDDGHVALTLLLGEQVEDLGLHGHVQRRGGLVGQEQLGPAGEGDGDHDPLAHAARHLVRVRVEPLLGLGDPDRLQERHCGLTGLGLVHAQVEPEGLGDLPTHSHDRVQRRHGILEHHRHLGAPELAVPLGVEGGDVPTLEHDPSGSFGIRRQQPHDRPGEHRLARAGLADDPEGLTSAEGERDPVDGADQASWRPERRAEVVDLEEGAVPGQRGRRRGDGAHRTDSRTSKRLATTSAR